MKDELLAGLLPLGIGFVALLVVFLLLLGGQDLLGLLRAVLP